MQDNCISNPGPTVYVAPGLLKLRMVCLTDFKL